MSMIIPRNRDNIIFATGYESWDKQLLMQNL